MLVEKTGTLSDLIPQLQKKIGFSDDDAQYVRLYEAHAQRIIKVLAENFPVLSLNEYTTLYAELIPEEERDTDDLIACYHFDKEANKAHNIPFILRTYEVWAGLH